MASAMKLLPCPFCGTTCHNIAWPREFEGRVVAKIECFTDGCYALVTGESPSLAAAAWNRRASPPAREEAPAEGAGDICERLDAILVEEDRMHPIGCSTWEEETRVAIDMAKDALRNRTSEPEAGEASERVGFKAGWAARTRAIDAYLMHDVTPDVDAAWHEYEPQGAPVAADVLIDRLQELLDSYAGNTRAYVDVLDFQALINRATHPAPATADKLRVAVEALEKIKTHRIGRDPATVWTGSDLCRGIAAQALATLNEQPQ